MKKYIFNVESKNLHQKYKVKSYEISYGVIKI